MNPTVVIEPFDQYNQAVVSNVHPPDWVNPEPTEPYNLIVLGAGTAGLITAAGASGLGAKVALIEKYLMGGDCLNVGCVPSKALIRASRAYAELRHASEFGVEISSEAKIHFPKVMERMRRLRAQISKNDSASRYRSLGVDVYLGEGRFTSTQTLEVGGKTLRFAKAVIATGARAAAPPIPGLEETGYLTNETLFTLTTLPPRLAVIGAGPIGCEMSQAFARFGSDVVLLQSAGQILAREDPDAAQCAEKALLRDGVKIFSRCTIQKASRHGREKILELDYDGHRQELVVDEILIGVGRAPNVEGLGLESAGVQFDSKNGILVNDTLQTSNRNIYAAGDCCSVYKFTHIADALARIAIQNALFPGPKKKASSLIVPWCTYTDPEIAHVGLYEKEAREKGIPVQTFVQELSEVDRAVLDGEEGFLKVHVRQGTDQILGATLVARHAGEMISELTLAMSSGAGLKTIAQTIHPYPTQAECIKKIADAYNRTRLTPWVKTLFRVWLAWQRRS